MKRNKLCLGTVKIGNPEYGFSSNCKPSEYTEILNESLRLGIDSFDTSPRYDNSEIKLGRYFSKIKKKPFISTKIDNLSVGCKDTPKKMVESIVRSIKNLRVDAIDLCYLHQNQIGIISDKYVQNGITMLKEMELIRESGTSIYSDEELKYTMDSNFYDWVQVPINILDISFYNKIINHKNPIKIAARSIFLQGIIFHESSIKKYIRNHHELYDSIKKIKKIADDYGKDYRDLCAQYVFNLDHLSMIIFGSTSIDNINFIEESRSKKLPDELMTRINQISSSHKEWTNPRNWIQPNQ